MSNEFLQKEYETSIEQLRFYDKRQEDLTKYVYALASAVVAAEFALYKLLQPNLTPFFHLSILALSAIVYIGMVLLYAGMLHNRVYFVFAARQVNAIRGHLLAKEAPDFKENQMYTRTDLRPFRFNSLHTVQLVGIVLISALFAGAAAYGLVAVLRAPNRVLIASVIAATAGAAQLILGIRCLISAGDKTADRFLCE